VTTNGGKLKIEYDSFHNVDTHLLCGWLDFFQHPEFGFEEREDGLPVLLHIM